jgi:hypothetical protein
MRTCRQGAQGWCGGGASVVGDRGQGDASFLAWAPWLVPERCGACEWGEALVCVLMGCGERACGVGAGLPGRRVGETVASLRGQCVSVRARVVKRGRMSPRAELTSPTPYQLVPSARKVCACVTRPMVGMKDPPQPQSHCHVRSHPWSTGSPRRGSGSAPSVAEQRRAARLTQGARWSWQASAARTWPGHQCPPGGVCVWGV